MVALIVAAHPEHDRVLKCFERWQSSRDALCLCTHSLVELYAVLTRMPASPRIGPDLAKRLIHENIQLNAIETVALDSADYMAVIESMADLGYAGGIVYDMLIVQAARKMNVDQIVTLNAADFRRLCQSGTLEVAVP